MNKFATLLLALLVLGARAGDCRGGLRRRLLGRA
jgi:hypothetical protein